MIKRRKTRNEKKQEQGTDRYEMVMKGGGEQGATQREACIEYLK